MDLFELGQILKLTRIQQSLTQHELATRTGVSISTISKLERGTLLEIGTVKLLQLFAAVELELRPLSNRQRRTLDDVHAENMQRIYVDQNDKTKASNLSISHNKVMSSPAGTKAQKPSKVLKTTRHRVRHINNEDKK